MLHFYLRKHVAITSVHTVTHTREKCQHKKKKKKSKFREQLWKKKTLKKRNKVLQLILVTFKLSVGLNLVVAQKSFTLV